MWPESDPATAEVEQGDSRNVGALYWNIFAQTHGETWAGSYLKACESSDLHRSVAEMVWPGVDRRIAWILMGLTQQDPRGPQH